MSTPFIGEVFEFTQPDGYKIQVRGWGDQGRAVFETLDGQPVVRGASGAYEYADIAPDKVSLVSTGEAVTETTTRSGLGLAPPPRVSDDGPPAVDFQRAPGLMDGKSRWKERRDERRRAQQATTGLRLAPGGIAMAPPTQHSIGNYTGLCILMDFPDVPAEIGRAEVASYCNEIGYSGFGNNGSVYDYFVEVSGNKLFYTNIVVGYITAINPRDYYTDPTIDQPIRAWELIEEGLTQLQANGFDFSQLTADSSGYIRALNVFYAGTRVNNWSEGLWPHSYHLQQPITLAPGRQGYDYQFTDMTSELTLATFCHENGHMICDFPDLYDYDYDSNGVGSFCLMCAGGSADRKNPTQVGAYLKYQAGWADSVTQLTPGSSHSAPAATNDFFVHSKDDDEYFIVENRQSTGRDDALQSSGLAIWHIDHKGDNDDQQMTNSQHYECSLEQADGAFDLEGDVNNGDAGDLFGAATQNRFAGDTVPSSTWWDGTASNLVIDNISAPADIVTFDVPGQAAGVVVGASSPMLPIPDNNDAGIRDLINLTGAGDVGSIEVGVELTHTYIGDLLVALLAPSGNYAVLHNRTGGSSNDLKRSYATATTPGLAALTGEQISGAWSLAVLDLAAGDAGILQNWDLRVTPAAVSAVHLSESPGTSIPDNDAVGITRSLAATQSGTVGDIEVEIDISHTYIADLIVRLTAPNGNGVDLHHLAGGPAENINTTYTTATTPNLGSLHGAPVQGTWQLTVSDHAGLDVGKLNTWGLRILPAP